MAVHERITTDADLLARSRDDAAAFGELYRRHAAAIYRYHCRCTSDPDAAHDLTAETFAQAWLARDRFRDEADGVSTSSTTTTGATTGSTTEASQPEATDWKGTVEDTVDATKHVNGGCGALNSAGTDWECYLGQEAVTQQIIGQSFLGQ
jgi:hypothetical protein